MLTAKAGSALKMDLQAIRAAPWQGSALPLTASKHDECVRVGNLCCAGGTAKHTCELRYCNTTGLAAAETLT